VHHNPFRRYLLVAVSVIALDQAVKTTVKLTMFIGQEIPLVGSLFKLHFIENNGAAFGMTLSHLLGGLSEDTGKLLLSLFSVAAVPVIIYVLYKSSNVGNRLPLYIALILGGAVGNIIDRVFYGMLFESMNRYEGGFMFGQVVDMFFLDIYQGPLPEWLPIWGGSDVYLWPVFNVADAAIFCGIVAILFNQNVYFSDTLPQASATALPAPPAESPVESAPTTPPASDAHV
jgi:signal peptidase II